MDMQKETKRKDNKFTLNFHATIVAQKSDNFKKKSLGKFKE